MGDRHFGSTYRPHLNGQAVKEECRNIKNVVLYGMVRTVFGSQQTNNQHCLTSQNSQDRMNDLFLDTSGIMVTYCTSTVSKAWMISEQCFESVSQQAVLFCIHALFEHIYGETE